MPSIFLLSRVCPVVSGPSVTISFIAKRIAVMLTPYGDSRTAGSKSFTECGWIEPLMTPNSIIAIRSGTAPGSFNLKHVNNPSLFPLKTDRKSKFVSEPGSQSKISARGGFAGTPEYASPEQFAGVGVDIRSDLYSLGVTLWVMMTGQTPFRGPSAEVL